MAIRIVRNDTGNCINFVGSTQPAYWNACLSAEVDAEDEPPEVPTTTSSQGQIGEAVIREVLGGELVEEHPVSEQDER